MDQISAFQRLWAPWRLPWIKESSRGVANCFLCDMLRDPPGKDRENLLLLRGERMILVLNRFPYCNGHLMVAPKRHQHDLMQLDEKDWAEIGLLTQAGVTALRETIQPHGFNLGWNLGRTSGAGLEDHLHQHIVPRWNGDTNFMPVVGKTRVISQDLWESYDQLHRALRALRVDS